MDGATQAFLGGWNKVKFYFMLGLPGETEEDICEIMHLCDRVARLYYDLIPKAERHGQMSDHGQHFLFCAQAVYTVPVGADEHRIRVPGKSPSRQSDHEGRIKPQEHPLQLA